MTNANPQQKPSPPVGHNSQGANSGGIIVTLVIDVGEGGGNIGAETCRLLHHPTPLGMSYFYPSGFNVTVSFFVCRSLKESLRLPSAGS